MNIIFMGSPDFALPALRALINSNHNILAVYTQPPQPAGRGYKARLTPVHLLAEEFQIDVKTPANFKNKNTIEEYKLLAPDIMVVVAYGIILPQKILDIPKFGAINIHPSKLPKYRGAAPLQRIILAGEKDSAVATIAMDAGIDTGDILLSEDFALEEDVTFQELHDKTALMGADLLIKTIDNISTIKPRPQSDIGSTYATKISKEEAQINWHKDAGKFIDRKIRGLNPFPGTFFIHDNKVIKLKAAKFVESSHTFKPGTVIDNKLSIACIGGIIEPLILQREGRVAMEIASFLQGYNLPQGTEIG